MIQNPKHHYLMVAGNVVFREEGQDAIISLTLNAIVKSGSKNIPVKLLARAQQTLQANFFTKMDGQKVEVVDVVILSLIPLGEMTDEEFSKVPENTELKERTK